MKTDFGSVVTLLLLVAVIPAGELTFLRWQGTLNFQGQQTFVLVNFSAVTVRFGSLQPFTVRKIGDFPNFLPALRSNDQFTRLEKTLKV